MREDHTVDGEPVNAIVAIDLGDGGESLGACSSADTISLLAAALAGRTLARSGLPGIIPTCRGTARTLYLAEIDANWRDRRAAHDRGRSGGIDLPAGMVARRHADRIRVRSLRLVEPLSLRSRNAGTARRWRRWRRSSACRNGSSACRPMRSPAPIGSYAPIRRRGSVVSRVWILRAERSRRSRRRSPNLARCAPTATASCFAPVRPIIPPASSRSISPSGRHTVLKKATDMLDRTDLALRDYLTKVESVEFPTTGGETAFGLFYPPRNPDYAPAPPASGRRCWSNATAGRPRRRRARSTSAMQYWTSRGIAVLDVNYGGSTGFGRAYRDRLQLELGRRRRRRLRGRRALPRRAGIGRRQALRHQRRQRRRLHDPRGAHLPRLLPRRGQLLRRERCRRACARHAQVRVALSRLADRALSAGGGALSRALAALSRGSAVEAGDLLPGRRGRRRAAEPGAK